MKISSITVAGFRNIAETRLELGGVAGLAAPNNYGKSNVLDAVAFALGFIAGGPGERRRMMALASCRPLNPRLAGEDFRFSVAFEDEGLGAYRHVEYGFALRWPRGEGDEPRITAETLKASHRAAGQKVAYLERREGPGPHAYRAGRAARSTRRLHLDGIQLALDVLTAVDGIGINPVVRCIRSLAFKAAGPLGAEDPRLPERLHRLAQTDPETYSRFECAVLTLFPEIERIDVEALEAPQARHDGGATAVPFTIKDAVCRLKFKRKGLPCPVDAALMSAGARRVIGLMAEAALAAGAPGCSIFAVEAIEAGLHPRLYEGLLDSLVDILGGAPLLVTSHAPLVIQYLKPERIYVGAPSGDASDDGVARFRRINAKKLSAFRRAASDRGLGFADYLFSLLCDDAYGQEILKGYLED